MGNNIKIAKKVLDTEIKGLELLKNSIDEQFDKAIKTVSNMKSAAYAGRLIVAGIGKSGHVARKIAATLASTGTPAYYVHPGEASHGDLGMITQNDVVLMLSNSGENNELTDLIHYTRRFDITLIGMTSNPDSTLAKYSDIRLLLPKTEEACPNGMAPTTSTTMMIAYGDALAVALLENMGLTKDQYKVFHPGGKLGQRLQKVSDIMIPKSDLATINQDSKMDAAILKLTEKNQGVVIVTDKNDTMLGIVTDGDLKRHMDERLLQKSVKDVMSKSPKTVLQSVLAAQALSIMTKTPGQYLTSLVVVDDKNNLVGLIRLQDCLHAGVE